MNPDRIVRRMVKGLMLAVFAVLFFTVFGYVVMRLWNWLTPALFGWHLITFWQALGILVLSKILFGGFRGGRPGRMRWRGRIRERWERMTPEEREKFRQSMRERCGPFASTAAEPKA
jgi:Ca2+/H+ antiporter, TMEM165/GDT1 family